MSAIPDRSPLSVGWRAELVELLDEVGLSEVLDCVSQYAILRAEMDKPLKSDLYELDWARAARRNINRKRATRRQPVRTSAG